MPIDASVSSRVRDRNGAEWDETDETLGLQVLVKTSSATKVIFEISDGVWFEGVLSSDGKEISGVWNNEGPGVGPLEGKRPTITPTCHQFIHTFIDRPQQFSWNA